MVNAGLLGRFLHGLVFFTFSLTVVFLQYRSRRIVLTRRLHWLGIFAICEATVAWNDLFAMLMPDVLFLPAFLRPALLACGYVFLIAFGVQAYLPEETPPRVLWRWVIGLNLLWVALYFGLLLAMPEQQQALIRFADMGVHYLLGFPGGVMVTLGLRRQSYQTLDVALRSRIRPSLRVVEGTLAMLSVFQLLLPAFPLIQSAVRLPAFWFSPAMSAWLWVAVGAMLTLGLNRALSAVHFEIEQWIEGVERLQTLAVDRERIGRDLHDGIIQSIYAAGLLLESVQPIIPSDPMRAQAQLNRVMDNLNETIQDIRRYIFDLRSDMPDDDLQSGIKRLLRDFHINTLLETDLEVSGEPVEIMSMERRRHIFQIVREALTNTSRHARARWVKIELDYNEHVLDMAISDDGIGMETLQVSKGYGLRNIRERVRLLDGTLRIESAPNEGVTFHLTVPY